MSHWGEAVMLIGKQDNPRLAGSYLHSQLTQTDSTQIFTSAFLRYLLTEVPWTMDLRRIDEMYRMRQIYGRFVGVRHGGMITTTAALHRIYVPLREQCRKFDAYNHAKIPWSVVPQLVLPPEANTPQTTLGLSVPQVLNTTGDTVWSSMRPLGNGTMHPREEVVARAIELYANRAVRGNRALLGAGADPDVSVAPSVAPGASGSCATYGSPLSSRVGATLREIFGPERAADMIRLNVSAYYDALVTQPRRRGHFGFGCGVQNCGLLPGNSSESARGCDGTKHSSLRGRLPTLEWRGQHGEWDAYLEAVYGSDVSYPVELQTFGWFYHDLFPLKNVQPLLLDIYCRSVPGHAWISWEEFRWQERRQLGFFVQHYDPQLPAESQPEPLRLGFSNHSWVEVMRVRVWHLDETWGTFYWHAKGSGLWINLGRTVVIDRACDRTALGLLSPKLRDAGEYETAQLTVSAHTLPHAMTNSRFEIVDFRRPTAKINSRTLSVCPPPAADVRRGWNHTLPCRCVAGADTVNCESKLPPFAKFSVKRETR